MAIGDIFKLALVGNTIDNRATMVNTFHYKQMNNLVFDEPGPDLVQAWLNRADAAYRATFSNIIAFNRFEVRGISDPLYVYEQTTAARGGTIAGECLPLQSTAVISWRSGLAGRSRRGRTYLPPAGETQQNGSIYVASYVTLLNNFANAARVLALDITHAGYQMVVWSTVLGQAFDVQGHISRDTVYTQRRRVPGRGS